MIVIKPCACPNSYQDKTYGKNKRVHNKCGKTSVQWRCTVCKLVKD